MNLNILKKIGLNDFEIQIYIFLLENPNKTIWEISRLTLINRPMLYRVIPSMIEKWLLIEILSWKRKHYISENPKILKNLLDDLKTDFYVFLPYLEKTYNYSFDKPVIKHFSGKSGIKNIFIDIWNSLEKWDVFYRYSSRIDIENTSIKQSDYDKYKKLREEKKLERMVITSEYLENFKSKRLEKDVVLIPNKIDSFDDNITKIVYWDKLAIIDYNTFESIIIENKSLAKFEKKLFKIMFKLLKNY